LAPTSQPGARRLAPRAGPCCGPGDFRSDGGPRARLAREYVRTTSGALPVQCVDLPVARGL